MLPADVLDDLIVYRRAHSCNNGSMDRDERKAVQSNGPWAMGVLNLMVMVLLAARCMSAANFFNLALA